LEIEAALQRNVRVIPILVDGATMPRADELPSSLVRIGARLLDDRTAHAVAAIRHRM
jgi:hypothetical protein